MFKVRRLRLLKSCIELCKKVLSYMTHNKVFKYYFSECDRVFVSTPGRPKNGTFESPKLIAEEDRSVQCIFTFVPRPGERVQVAFTHFRVRGIPPE